jgi:hypothetical protein
VTSQGFFWLLMIEKRGWNWPQLQKIMLKLHLREPLLEEMDIEAGTYNLIQSLDYVNVPFHCHWCKTYGHLKHVCLEL